MGEFGLVSCYYGGVWIVVDWLWCDICEVQMLCGLYGVSNQYVKCLFIVRVIYCFWFLIGNPSMFVWFFVFISWWRGGWGGEHVNLFFKIDVWVFVCWECVLGVQKEGEVGFEEVCLSCGVKDELVSVYCFIERYSCM